MGTLGICIAGLMMTLTSGPAAPAYEARLPRTDKGLSCSLQVDLSKPPPKFKKHPDFSWHDVFYGTLPAFPELPFAWDMSEGKLYLDLNRNRDLTDDPAGTFIDSHPMRSYHYFSDVRSHSVRNSQTIEYRMNLSICIDLMNRFCRINLLSGWQGPIVLNGKRWILSVIDNLDGQIDARDRFFVSSGDQKPPYFYDQLMFPVPAHLFLDGRSYETRFTIAPARTGTEMIVTLTEISSAMGKLIIEGQSIRHLFLQRPDSMLAVVSAPTGPVELPIGTYCNPRVFLENSRPQELIYAQAGMTLDVTKDGSPALKIGGPLINSVEVDQKGNTLQMNYKLIGAGGETYSDSTRKYPPRFTIRNHGLTVNSGQFAFG